jgi:tRNA(Ile)-lysidine synthase TilS/MesJ
VIETTLLNVFYAGNFKTMLPKLKSENFPGMELIRPLYYVEERHIINYMNYCNVQAMNCGCEVASGKISSKRREIKELINQMKQSDKNIEINIFQSANNVNLDCILGFTKNNQKHSFLEEYDLGNNNIDESN